MSITTTLAWEDIVAEKKSQQSKCIPQEWMIPSSSSSISSNSPINVLDIPSKCGILTPKELEITSIYDGVDLISKLISKEFTSHEVTLAFCKRAAIAHQLTNCLTEIFFDQALERAKFLDDYLSKEGKPIGPLHGLPISLKDSYSVKDIFSTIGYVSFMENKPESNSPVVDILLKLGAVLYVKTNLPQTMMVADTDNNIFGRTLNPYKLTLTAGGSSGGEGALIALRGSILGLATDIAGSIRIPALCCGTFGFKPSTKRIPFGGQTPPGKLGSPGIIPSAGPLATSVRDLRLFLESVINEQPSKYDAFSLALPWRTVEAKPLTIGVIIECPSSKVKPPGIRAMRSAVEKLKDHRIVMLEKFPSFQDAGELSWTLFDLDNELTAYKHVSKSGEPMVQSIQNLYGPRLAVRKPISLEDVFDLNMKRSSYISQWHKICTDNRLDVIICPGAQHGTAVPHDTFGIAPYTCMWNLIDYPACVIPYLEADKSIDVADENFPDYDPEAVDGAPCNIQVAAPSYHDEELMVAVELIQKALSS